MKSLETKWNNSTISIDAKYQKCIFAVENMYKTLVKLSAFRYKTNTKRHFVIFTNGKYEEVNSKYSFYLFYFVIVNCLDNGDNARHIKDEYKTTFFSSFSRLSISYCYSLPCLTHCHSSSLILTNVLCSSFSFTQIFYPQRNKNCLLLCPPYC
jgi:hypothetical protein